jgi:iron complex transport system substrate-binding protein
MEIIDQIGNVLSVHKEPRRIICLVPSITELLFDLGLGDRVVGVTKFCIHPNEAKLNKTIVGGTKNVHLDNIKALRPDLIIANQEENVKEQIAILQTFCNVFVSKVDTLQSSLDLIKLIGDFFGNPIETTHLYLKLLDCFHDFPQLKSNLTYIYLIWKNPYMAAGNDTYIHNLLENFGFENKVNSKRYPEINLHHYQEVDFIFLSSEPFPFKQKDVDEFQQLIGNKTKVILVDGEFFSWYGSRILKLETYKKEFIEEIKFLN